ncbi:MAG: hypothetical protein U5R06_04435 [candidate division KSB1 bacterium]|nr:hypothetical protein [candidate division KSB1 bacterium]
MQVLLTFVALLLTGQIATLVAYIGPGSGLSAIGTLIAFVAALLLAIIGFVWYPVKRLMAKRREKKQDTSEI